VLIWLLKVLGSLAVFAALAGAVWLFFAMMGWGARFTDAVRRRLAPRMPSETAQRRAVLVFTLVMFALAAYIFASVFLTYGEMQEQRRGQFYAPTTLSSVHLPKRQTLQDWID
jgi:hypothetical protein